MKLWQLILVVIGIPIVLSCGGSGTVGRFDYSHKYSGQWADVNSTNRHSDYYIYLDEQGNIVSAQSYSSQGAKCSIAGSVRKTGKHLDLTVILTVDEGNAACTNVSLSASAQLSFISSTGWWEGDGTGFFSDTPNSPRTISFSLAPNDDW